ncbi:chitobiase/beta-hexosaminidase C-terminal domain-containing protein [Piscibacillus salipiscarius]|uniref:chitobiase/beta-hexosaminidase C-terminal domain-containing protein n=1 Tax=Piscibacillus salipiscarius TaxID=299480 RepID=UPI0006D10C17|nr:chitobiase/beta-hexosaminidase C-terminal domain-containing protein [Piscibacillus salipiscarius]
MEEENLESVNINGSEATLDNGNYEADITLEQGENSISVKAVDQAGNETVQTITVYVDSVAPIITIESPEDGDTVHKNL